MVVQPETSEVTVVDNIVVGQGRSLRITCGTLQLYTKQVHESLVRIAFGEPKSFVRG